MEHTLHTQENIAQTHCTHRSSRHTNIDKHTQQSVHTVHLVHLAHHDRTRTQNDAQQAACSRIHLTLNQPACCTQAHLHPHPNTQAATTHAHRRSTPRLECYVPRVLTYFAVVAVVELDIAFSKATRQPVLLCCTVLSSCAAGLFTVLPLQRTVCTVVHCTELTGMPVSTLEPRPMSH